MMSPGRDSDVLSALYTQIYEKLCTTDILG